MSDWEVQRTGRDTYSVSKKPQDPEWGFVAVVIGVIVVAAILSVIVGLVDRIEDAAEKRQQAKRISLGELVSLEYDYGWSNAHVAVTTSFDVSYDEVADASGNHYKAVNGWLKLSAGDGYGLSEPHIGYAEICVNGQHPYSRMSGTVFADADVVGEKSITFLIYADGRCIYDSGALTATTAAKTFDLNISGVDTIRFEARSDFYVDGSDHFPSLNVVDVIFTK